MAAGYWDTDTGTTTGDLGDWWSFDSNITSTTSTVTTNMYWPVSADPAPPKRMIVNHPGWWNSEKTAAYVKLVNKETNTGWNIEMVINGDVAIVDPDIEVREMDEFIPLLKKHASVGDRRKIDVFFSEEE